MLLKIKFKVDKRAVNASITEYHITVLVPIDGVLYSARGSFTLYEREYEDFVSFHSGSNWYQIEEEK